MVNHALMIGLIALFILLLSEVFKLLLRRIHTMTLMRDFFFTFRTLHWFLFTVYLDWTVT